VKIGPVSPGSFETAAGSQPAVRTPQGNPGEISYQTDQGIAVNDFVFAPDGKTALSAGHDGTVQLLDAATGKELQLFAGFGPNIVQAAYSRTGSHAVIGASDSSVTFIDLASGVEAGRFQTPGYLYRMAVSPDDGSIAVLNNESEVRIYQADGVLLTQFTGKLSPNVYGIAWCPESDCLLVWGKAGMLEVWDRFKLALVDTLRGHAGVVRAAAFSPDGKRFATVADDKQVLIWNATNGKRVRALTGLKEAPMALAWSRGGKRLAVETDSAKAFVWNVTDGKPPVVVGPERGLGKEWVAFTPDGRSVVLGGRHGPVATRIPD
jgi:WD40 repeat protein